MEKKKRGMYPEAWNWVKEFAEIIAEKKNLDDECVGYFGPCGADDTNACGVNWGIFDAIYDNFDSVCDRIWKLCPFVDGINIKRRGYNDAPMVVVTFE